MNKGDIDGRDEVGVVGVGTGGPHGQPNGHIAPAAAGNEANERMEMI